MSCRDKYESHLKSNKIRTNLLILASKELKELKKVCYSKINSKTLSTAEKEFSNQNDQIVNLKVETFSNRLESKGVCQAKSNSNLLKIDLNETFRKHAFKSNNKIDESIKSISTPSISTPKNNIKEKINRKFSVSHKKMEYFNNNTLNKMPEIEEAQQNKLYNNIKKCAKKLEFANNAEFKLDDDLNTNINYKALFNNKPDLELDGLQYLRKLARKLIKKKKNKVQSSLLLQMENLFEETKCTININYCD